MKKIFTLLIIFLFSVNVYAFWSKKRKTVEIEGAIFYTDKIIGAQLSEKCDSEASKKGIATFKLDLGVEKTCYIVVHVTGRKPIVIYYKSESKRAQAFETLKNALD